jgi:hypothetical protein
MLRPDGVRMITDAEDSSNRATAGPLPDGYDHLGVHRVIGHGEPAFRRAAERLMSWQMHRTVGLTVEATTPRVEPDSRVRLRLGRHLFRISFGCQVVYVVEEEERRRLLRFAFQAVGRWLVTEFVERDQGQHRQPGQHRGCGPGSGGEEKAQQQACTAESGHDGTEHPEQP